MGNPENPQYTGPAPEMPRQPHLPFQQPQETVIPEAERRELEYSEALDWLIYSFRFSRGRPGAQDAIFQYLHLVYPKVKIRDTATQKKLVKKGVRGVVAVAQKASGHRVKVPTGSGRAEAEIQLDRMLEYLNASAVVYPLDRQQQRIDALCWEIVRSLVDAESKQLLWPDDPEEPDQKYLELLKKLPGRTEEEKLQALRLSPAKYIKKPDEDPWWSDICGYLMNSDEDLFERPEKMPKAFRQLLNDLRRVLCQFLLYEVRQPLDQRDVWNKLQGVIQIYNSKPHPHRDVDLQQFLQRCMVW